MIHGGHLLGNSKLKARLTFRKSSVLVPARCVTGRFVNCHFVFRVLLGKMEKLALLAPLVHL